MPELTEKQQMTLRTLQERVPDLHVERHRTEAILSSVSGTLSDRDPGPLEAVTRRFLKENQDLFGIEDVDAELGDPVAKEDSDQWTHFTLLQFHRGIRVWSGRVTAHYNAEKALHGITNAYRPVILDDIEPKIDKEEAIEAARTCGAGMEKGDLLHEPELFVLPDEQPALIWVLALTGTHHSYLDDSSAPGAWRCFVDAQTGKVIRRTSLVKEVAQTSTGLSIRNPGRLTQVTRTLQTWHDDATGRDELRDTVTGAADGVEIRTLDNGSLSRDDDPAPLGDNAWDRTTGETSTSYATRDQYQPAEVDAHHFGGEIYRFWRRAPFNRNSFDDSGMDIVLNTHLNSTSAWWDGSWINFGDGDMTRYTFKSGQLDVFGHESTHAVFQYEIPPAGTTYCGQSGNAEEAFCDIFGCFTERNWLFERLITVPPWSCLRNLIEPGDPNARNAGPDHFDDYDDTRLPPPDDCGASDPHQNCHIIAHACYLMTHGGAHHRAGRIPVDIPVYPGFGWDDAERIYYRALTHGFTGDPGLGTDTEPYFDKVRTEVLNACEWIFGRNSCQYRTARLAYYAVGLQPAGQSYGFDAAITPWGDITDEGPRWQSPDIYVLDYADAPAEPLLNEHNRLFARVQNIGDVSGSDVRVRLSYAPFSTTYRHEHFKEIDTSSPFTLAAGEVREVEVDWDLTDLDEDNGGLWPAVDGVSGIRAYNHFCVRAEILCTEETNDCNNTAQNNFTNVELGPGDTDEFAFIIACPWNEPAVGRLILEHRLPRSWMVTVDGTPFKNIPLHPANPIPARLQVQASRNKELEPPIDGEIRGTFGPRKISATTILLRELGPFTADLKVKYYYASRRTFSGELKGRLERTGQRFTAQVKGLVADPVAFVVKGSAEGYLLHEDWRKHEPFAADFEGELTPTREVSVSLIVDGFAPSGITVHYRRRR